MDQTWKCTAVFLLACCMTAQSSECRLLQQEVQGATERYTESPATGRSCSTVCSNPLLFANVFKTQPTSYACVATGGSGTMGFQTGAGSSTCTINSGSQVVESSDYNCLCLAPAALPGLSKPDAFGSCAASCKPYAGEIGSPISAAGSSVCMASAEAGNTNHFGVVTSKGACEYISGPTITQTSSFSCVCAYGAAPAPSSMQTAGALPQTQVQTAG